MGASNLVPDAVDIHQQHRRLLTASRPLRKPIPRRRDAGEQRLHALRGRVRRVCGAAGSRGIRFLKGRLAVKQPPMLLVDVNASGTSWEAPCRRSTVCRQPASPSRCSLHLVVRETRTSSTGSAPTASDVCFARCSRSPGLVQKFLGAVVRRQRRDFLAHVEAEDFAMLTRIPGIGRRRRGADHRDARQRAEVRRPALGGGSAAAAWAQCRRAERSVHALVALGYKPPEVTRL